MVIVLGCHRSGTGCVSQMMTQLGVNMGPGGNESVDDTWEDRDFVTLHRKIFHEFRPNGGYYNEAWQYPKPRLEPKLAFDWISLARHRHRDSTTHWGFKDPRFLYLLDFGLGALATLGIVPRLVWITRNPEAIAQSLRRRDKIVFETCYSVAVTQSRQLEAMYERYQAWPFAKLSYEGMVADPRQAAEELAYLVNVSDARLVQNAANIVKPRT